MSKDCIIDGKACTACCRTSMSPYGLHDMLKFDKPKGDIKFMLENWIPLTKRQAKKKNPFLFRQLKAHKNVVRYFFRCKQVTEQGCGIYQDRPHVCSGYPGYDYSLEEINEINSRGPEYHPKCTQYPVIPTVTIDD